MARIELLLRNSLIADAPRIERTTDLVRRQTLFDQNNKKAVSLPTYVRIAAHRGEQKTVKCQASGVPDVKFDWSMQEARSPDGPTTVRTLQDEIGPRQSRR